MFLTEAAMPQIFVNKLEQLHVRSLITIENIAHKPINTDDDEE